MKRELASVLSSMLRKVPHWWFNIMAYQMDGCGWEKSVYEMMDLLDNERYVMYDIRATEHGLDIDVWFTTISVG